ncbi:Gmad2 immunoglobulin-like domain-containing protein [Nocardioides donggukensis]|uniref:GerMN domain-containing protein n=1 Tax=Nocardioides donggukensis TaxID=2774019 RepID=A0A927Q1F2_9ACTN|nr:Gmad2 immunoglobulin-like domain-containing protein [Nocardioides donggukensis]MBD8870017.1 GerMN domain-containing protein [Nocardioides donggukensis]
MSPHDPAGDDLSRLLHDAVDDLEPRPGIEAIRSRTKENTMPTRPWIWGVGGAVVATAATITAVAFAGNLGSTGSQDPGPASGSASATESAPSPDESPAPTADASPSPTAGASDAGAIPVYWVGDTPQGPRLYREFQAGTPGTDPVTDAARRAVSGSALDPDYATGWPEGTDVAGVESSGETIVVDLTGAPRTRPDGMSRAQAQMAVEQVVYTVQAARGEGRAPVDLRLDGERTDQVLGVPTSEPLANGDPLSTLALVNITAPEEGATVSGEFRASGLASSFEATVPWQVRRGDEVVLTGFSTAEGWMDRLYPWQTTVDVSSLDPGEYLFVAQTDDPSGGAEGAGPHEDTKVITVE